MPEPTSARLSLQLMRLSYFKNTDFTPSLQRNITCESVAYRSYFTNKSFRAVCSLRDLSDMRASMKAAKPAYSFSLATNPSPTRARSYPLNINPNPTRNPKIFRDPSGSGRVADL